MKREYLFIVLLLLSGFYNARASEKYAYSKKQELTQQIVEEMESVNATLPQINLLRKKGEKRQAKALIENTIQQLEKIEANRKELGSIVDFENEDVPSLLQIHKTKQELVNIENRLRYTNIFVQCEVGLFGDNYDGFCEEILGKISDNDVLFVDNKEEAEWKVIIKAKAREHTKLDFGGITTYFAFVDADLAITKTASGKLVYQKRISEKGGDYGDYQHAAQEACKYIIPKLTALIKEQIQQ